MASPSVTDSARLYNRGIEPVSQDHDLDAGLLRRYQAILASTLDPIVIIDANGVVHVASDSVERVFGWTAEELIGQNIKILMPEPHRGNHDDYLANYRRTGVTNILGQTREFEGVRRDGTTFPIDLAVSRVDVPDQDHPLFAGIIRDITRRKRAELESHLLKDLALATAKADGLTEAMVVALEHICEVTGWDYGEAWMPDDESQLLCDTPVWHTRDPALARFQELTHGMTFAPGEGLPGRVWLSREPTWLADLFDDAVFKRAEAASHLGLKTGVAVPIMSGELVVAIMAFFMKERRSEDTRLLDLVRAAVAPLGPVIQRRQAEETVAHYQQHLEDEIAARTQELEASHAQLRLADRLASIGTLAAGLGHDMNNVLLPIRCRLDALQDGTLPDSHREHFESVRRSVEYLQQLTDGLHLLSLDPNEPQPVGESVDVANWWEQVGQLLTTAVPRHATLACELPDDLPPIAMPPHGLTQAILNLIVNAGEAMTEPGTIRIWAEADESRGVVRLRVADDGPGMPPEVRRRALDPFFTTKKRGLGTGLGLSLVHSVAQTAGGSVQIESEPGRGTTVTMIFPIASGDDGRPAVDLEAAISLEDRRLATLLSALLQTAGLATQHVEGRTPPETDLWVTSPTATPVDAAREFMQTSRRQIVLVGEADDAWRELTVITIDPTADFGVIRERVGETVAALTRATRT